MAQAPEAPANSARRGHSFVVWFAADVDRYRHDRWVSQYV